MVSIIGSLIAGVISYQACQTPKDYVLRGRALDRAGGSPIHKAAVGIVGDASSLSTITREDGSFQLEIRRVGSVRILVSHESYDPREEVVSLPQNEVLLVRMDRRSGPTLKGIVRNAKTKDPLVGARVTVGAATTTSDSAGVFRLPLASAVVVPTDIRIIAEKPGYDLLSLEMPFSPDYPYQLAMSPDSSSQKHLPLTQRKPNEADLKDLFKSAKARARQSQDLGDYAGAAANYMDAWNTIPAGSLLRHNVLQKEVEKAWNDYGNGRFKSASDRLAEIVEPIKTPLP